jgi:hypothetical protein
VDPKIHGWHSTGLYAAAGEVITIQVPESVVDLPKHRHPRIRIGVHRDTLWHLDRWKRWPEITLEKRIEGTETRLASPFGGLVYVTVPQPRQEGPFTVEIEGAVPAPYFVLGETDLETWREELRHAPAPWAELESDRVILTVPSEVVRDLDDPKEVMLFWNRVLDACAELIGRPMERNRPERYVADRQISAGYMHSGYPIMTWLDVRKKYVDLESLRQGNWGFFHEMGHNHQHPAWTFEGTVEVTCNLFTLYIYDQVLGIPPRRARDVLEDPKRSSKIEKYLQDGAEFSQWQRDPFLALIMYVQLQEAFGWEAYRNVFAEYRDTPPGELPRGEQEKRDQWMVRFSREVGRNLGPFFDRWGVPVTDEAKASIEDLPVWMPDEMR